MNAPRHRGAAVGAVAFVACAAVAAADQIGDVVSVSVWEQIARFIRLEDAVVRHALLASVLLGLICGLLGTYLVVRRMALLGDAIGHAVLPGVCVGYLLTGQKAALPIFLGATAAGVLGALTIGAVQRTTRIKQDAAMAIVLSAFFGIGIVLLTFIQSQPGGNKSGLDKFLFGQAAAIGPDHLRLMLWVAGATVLAVILLRKELLVTSFDPAYARCVGVPERAIHLGLMLLMALAIVVSIQAVGVVLVVAMLVTPAAAAQMITRRLGPMLLIAAATGIVAGASGTFLSFLGTSLPSGPFMVLSASAMFFVAFLFAPGRGVVARAMTRRRIERQTGLENTLKAVFHVLEEEGFRDEEVGFEELATASRETKTEAEKRAATLARAGYATVDADGLRLTRTGLLRAGEVVRNHRLWELYLVQQANFASDHVHDNAEKIEHILGHEVVHRLERLLKNPVVDPHGRPIPSLQELERMTRRGTSPAEAAALAGAAAVSSSAPHSGEKNGGTR